MKNTAAPDEAAVFFVREAVSAAIEHLFQTEGVDYIHSGYLDFNIPSRELPKKLGFAYLTTRRFRREEGGEELVGIENVLRRDE